MGVGAEYEVAVEYIKKNVRNEIVLSTLSSVAKKIDVLLRSSKFLESNSMAQTAFSLISEETSSEVVKKNMVLFVYRMCLLLKCFDSLPFFEKMTIVFEAVNVLQEEQEGWLTEHEKKLQPLHDKNERRKRRKDLFEVSDERHKSVNDACIKFLKGFVQHFAPQGTESLFLPSFARMFVPANYLQDNLEKIALLCDQVVGSRVWKETVFFYVMTILFQDTPSSSRAKEKALLEIPKEILEQAHRPCTYVLNLLGAIEPGLRFLPKEEASHKAVCILSDFFEKFSLEQCFLSLIPLLLIERQPITTEKLEDFIDAVSGNPKAISFLLKKVAQLQQPEIKISVKPSFKDLIMIGVQGAMVSTVVKEKADEFVYNEIPLKVLQYTHRFVVSPAFDRFLYKIFDSCIFKVVIKK